MRPLISDWHIAPEAERRKVRRLLIIVIAMALIDLALWLSL